jgi:hypothetical protein
MKETRFKLHYRASKFWLVFWCIFCFPIALVLLLTASAYTVNQTIYNLKYDGSRFWLCFWVFVFFPIAFILLFLNGFSARTEKPEAVS